MISGVDEFTVATIEGDRDREPWFYSRVYLGKQKVLEADLKCLV